MEPSSSRYVLVFDLPQDLKENLAETAGDCCRALNFYPSPGRLGYHVTVEPPFMCRDDGVGAIIAAFEGLSYADIGPVRLPTGFGRFDNEDDEEIVLYFGGAEPDLVEQIKRIRHRVCGTPLELIEVGIPHCSLASTRPGRQAEERLSLCEGVFEDLPFPNPLMLDTLVLFREEDDAWHEMARTQLSLVAAAH